MSGGGVVGGGGATVGSANKINVAVDMGDTSCYVKVHAPDRRGLLQDILKALQLLPMDVHRAAVTTNLDAAGVIWVTDIFELKINTDGSVPRISSDEVRLRLQSSLLESYMEYENPEFYNKKRKGENINDGHASNGQSNSGQSFDSD